MNALLKITGSFLLIVIFIAIISSCRKEEHRIRVKNDYGAAFTTITIGNVTFENIPSGATTEYRQVTPGDFKISGTTADNKVLAGSGKVSGKGHHHWTITAHADGLRIQEDKK